MPKMSGSALQWFDNLKHDGHSYTKMTNCVHDKICMMSYEVACISSPSGDVV